MSVGAFMAADGFLNCQYVAGTKQNVFVSNINQALIYYEYEIGTAEIELIKTMSNYGIKSYTIEIL